MPDNDDTILVATPPIIEPKPKTGLGPQPIPTKFGDKYRAEFAKLEKTTEPDDDKPIPKPKEEPSNQLRLNKPKQIFFSCLSSIQDLI